MRRIYFFFFPYSPFLVCCFCQLENANSNAPAVSAAAGALSSLTVGNGSNGGDDDAQWDDAALAAKTSRKGVAVAVPSGATTKEYAETKAMALKTHTSGNEQEDIVEKLRVEETKAKLAAAREGMEREAQRIKDDKEKKEEVVTSARFGNAAAGMSGVGGKYVPSHKRAGGTGMATGWGSRMSSSQKKVDTEDENLFPDLATADAIIEKQKLEQPAFKVNTKTPVGGGATWGASASTTTSSSAAPARARPKLNLKKKTQTAEEESAAANKVEEETPDVAVVEEVKSEAVSPVPANEEPAATDPSPANEVEVAAAPAPAPIKPKKKKKKKDISTFGKK